MHKTGKHYNIWPEIATLAQKLAFWPFWAIFDQMPTVGQAITMPVFMFQSKQKMFLAPTGASYNIATRKHIFGKQEQTKN